jgi:hypothetical protein
MYFAALSAITLSDKLRGTTPSNRLKSHLFDCTARQRWESAPPRALNARQAGPLLSLRLRNESFKPRQPSIKTAEPEADAALAVKFDLSNEIEGSRDAESGEVADHVAETAAEKPREEKTAEEEWEARQ